MSDASTEAGPGLERGLEISSPDFRYVNERRKKASRGALTHGGFIVWPGVFVAEKRRLFLPFSVQQSAYFLLGNQVRLFFYSSWSFKTLCVLQLAPEMLSPCNITEGLPRFFAWPPNQCFLIQYFFTESHLTSPNRHAAEYSLP